MNTRSEKGRTGGQFAHRTHLVFFSTKKKKKLLPEHPYENKEEKRETAPKIIFRRKTIEKHRVNGSWTIESLEFRNGKKKDFKGQKNFRIAEDTLKIQTE